MNKHPKVFLSAEKIQGRIEELARDIREEFKGEPLVVIGILQGSFIFYADLVRRLGENVRCEFLALSGYPTPAKRSGEVKLLLDIDGTLEGKNLLLVDDLVDKGLTLRFLERALKARHPKVLRSCALLRRVDRAVEPVLLDYVGFEIDDHFVVGYGIDHEGMYRGLPYIGILAKEKVP